MKENLKKVRKISFKTIEKIENKKIGNKDALAIAFHCSNVIKSCVAELQYGNLNKSK